MERRDRTHRNDVFRIGRTSNVEGQADVSDKVRRLEHGREMGYRHALVRRDGAKELVGGNVVDVDEPRGSAHKKKRAGEGDGDSCYRLVDSYETFSTIAVLIGDTDEIADACASNGFDRLASVFFGSLAEKADLVYGTIQ
jgi:hypothetical protein